MLTLNLEPSSPGYLELVYYRVISDQMQIRKTVKGRPKLIQNYEHKHHKYSIHLELLPPYPLQVIEDSNLDVAELSESSTWKVQRDSRSHPPLANSTM